MARGHRHSERGIARELECRLFTCSPANCRILDMHYMLLPIGGVRGSEVNWVKLDQEDYEWARQFQWTIIRSRNTRYAVRKERGKKRTEPRLSFHMHREILGLSHGDKRQGDHKNRDGLDNRRSNLRIATAAENAENVPSRRRNLPRNVVKHGARYQVQIKRRGERFCLGSFSTIEEADAVATAWRREHMAFA